MTSTVAAIYQRGVFRPLEPLTLPESTKVQIQVLSPQHITAFQRRLMIIRELLMELEETLGNRADQKIFPQILQADLKMLWHLCQPIQREFCAMLELSAVHLDASNLTSVQIAAFRFGLDLLEQDTITKTDIDRCYDLLVDAGLPPSFSYDKETVQSYLDER